MTVSRVAGGGDALARVQRENETLYAVIKTVSSSLDLRRVLDGIVEIATDATTATRPSSTSWSGIASSCAPPRRATRTWSGRWAGGSRRGYRVGRAHEDARVHPRQRDERPAHEVRARARGGAVPVDGRRAGARATRRRGDGCDRSPYRGPARVRRRSAQLSRAHRVAGCGRDRERQALRGHAPAGRRADHAHPAQPGARRGHAARGPLRRGHARRPPADRRRLVPDLAHRSRCRRAQPRRLRPARRHRPPGAARRS